MPKTEAATRKPVVPAEPPPAAGRRIYLAGATVSAGGRGRFRRLKWNELVSQGDFVANGRQGFELWEGPSGFRAHSFVKPIYRREEDRPGNPKDSS